MKNVFTQLSKFLENSNQLGEYNIEKVSVKKATHGDTTRIYKSANVKVLGNIYTILESNFEDGTFEYVSILKSTNNPFKTLGNEYKSWDDAVAHYKSKEMKAALLMAELTFKNTSMVAESKMNESVEKLTPKKYYDVVFLKDYVINNIYIGENSSNIDVNIKKGDKVRLYLDKNKSDETKFCIKAIRPLLDKSTNENQQVEMGALWNGSFLLDKEVFFEGSNLPFKIIQ